MPPVVVTVDAAGNLVDAVGELGCFTGGTPDAATLIALLLDLVVGQGGRVEMLGGVELSPGCYADIHVVDEGDLRHFVLLDASQVMRSLQASQQQSNQLALESERQLLLMQRADTGRYDGADAKGVSLRRPDSVFAEFVRGVRGAMTSMAGSTVKLERHLVDDTEGLKLVAEVRRAFSQLDAVCSNGLVALGNASMVEGVAAVDLDRLAALLHDEFALQAQRKGLRFEVYVPSTTHPTVVQGDVLRQILVNLVAHAIEGASNGVLLLAFTVGSTFIDVEISADPHGFSSDHFAPLVTTDELLRSDAKGSLALAVSQYLLRRMDAQIELVQRKEGGYLLWLRVPTRRVAAGSEEVGNGSEMSHPARPSE